MSSLNRQVPSRVAVKTVLAIAAVLALTFLVACGSSSPHGQPPPTGGFSNSNLSGTYAFSTEGEDVNGCIIAIAGTFAANGKGGISGGTIDVVEPCFPPSGLLLQGVGVTGGSYNVGADGRPESKGGLLTLNTASNGAFPFDYVLSSSNGGLITYYSTLAGDGGSGSGSFQLQTSVTQSSIENQSYAFSTSGVSASAEATFGMAGAFTLDATGNVGVSTTGVGDVNNDGVADCGLGDNCTITAGNIALSTTAGAQGTASFTFSTVGGPFTFDVYPVTPSQLIFIETDGSFVTVGNAFSQSSSIPTGNNVFSVAGFDSSAGAPLAAVGLLITNGSGAIPDTTTVEDINDANTAAEVTGYSGTYTTPVNGRSVISLSGFYNGGGLGGDYQFAAYPSTGGVQLLEIDNLGVTAGVLYAQGSSPTFASGQGYGMDLTGANLNLGTEEDDIAEFTDTSGTLTGLIDFNDEGTTTAFAQTFSTSYAADTTGIPGRGTIAIPANGNGYGMATYVVNSSTALGVVNDGSGVIALGMIATQNATAGASANLAQQHLVAIRASIAGKHLKKSSTR